ncbi:MAG: EAL domain-containing protein [Sulfurimonas sp.]|nr:EAL domain-containing protein [Sulfurimonas sp.]
MNIRNKMPYAIIFSAILFFIISEILSYNISLEEEINTTYKKDKQILKNLFSSQAKYLSAISNMLTSDSLVVTSYLQNNPKIIQEHVTPIWNKLKLDKLIYEIHFFKPPAISFVNFSNFKSLGEESSTVRTDIAWVTSSFKEDSHLLMCKTYAGYRNTSPILDKNGTILGGLSVGKKVDWIPSVIKNKTDHDSFLVYTKAAPNSLSAKYYDDFMKNKIRFNGFILANKTINVSVEELDNIDFEKSIQDITIDGRSYTLFSYPIIDFNKKTMGYLCTVTKLEIFNKQFIRFSIKELVIIFFTTLILLYITKKQNAKVLQHIKHIRKLTDSIKKRDFSILHQDKLKMSDAGTPALMEIEKNIIDMGVSLEKQYHELEDDNRSKEKQLITQLYLDELTGLGNRNALLRDLQTYKNSFISLLNIRGFKYINDAFGFETGNYILVSLAEVYLDIFGSRVHLYRISNDEFAFLCDNSSKEEFINSIDRAIDEIDKLTFEFNGARLGVNIYAGISLDKDEKLSKATEALIHAKDDKMKYIIYKKDNDTKELQIQNIETTNKISYALRHDQIIVHYQAIVTKDATVFKYEALVRMIDNDKILSPYFFLEVSKKTNMYSDITKVVIEKTFEKFKDSDKLFSINIIARDILNEEIVALIYKKLEEYKNPQQVIFELVESDDLYNLKKIDTFLKNIRKRGAKIAIDDFGTGYSNFSYIMKMKPDYLKIDGSLIKNLESDMAAYKVVKTIINFAHDLDILIVAEFIHNKAVFDICVELGVDEFQGYYFSQPKEALL